ncbi:hypothetical protein BDB01DRAFT_787347 [Pilobolus umbonatus]|nr:hypothetical protein BDB01DRAFT_787347 [Pilobolus umbonatus]
MSTYYEILGVNETASYDQIKQQFQYLILRNHPDKQLTGTQYNKAHDILKAWEILRDKEKRMLYDAELKNKPEKKDIAINAEVDLDDMEYAEGEGIYTFDCRCSGVYIISEDELESGIEIISCDNCSLKIRVMYDEVEEEISC